MPRSVRSISGQTVKTNLDINDRVYIADSADSYNDRYIQKNAIIKFQEEVDKLLAGSVVTNTVVDSNLQWSSNQSSIIKLDYLITESPFGDATFTRAGTLTIVVTGDSTSLVFIDDTSALETSVTTTGTVFDVDVLSSQVRLLYQKPSSGNAGVRFFNISHQIQANVGDLGGGP